MRMAANILHLGIKELYSLLRDPVLLILTIYIFTFAIYSVATGVQTELRNAAVAVVDEDHTVLSNRLRGAFLPPYFQPAASIGGALWPGRLAKHHPCMNNSELHPRNS